MVTARRQNQLELDLENINSPEQIRQAFDNIMTFVNELAGGGVGSAVPSVFRAGALETSNNGIFKVQVLRGLIRDAHKTEIKIGDDSAAIIGVSGYVSAAMPHSLSFVDGDVNVGADNITILDHTLKDNDIVTLTSTGTLPTGLSAGTTYYVKVSSIDVIQLATTKGGSAVNITGLSGSGTHYLRYGGPGSGWQPIGTGLYVGEWSDWTIEHNWGSNIKENGKQRRVGDSIELKGYIEPDTGSTPSGNLILTIPHELTVNTSKVIAGGIDGYAYYDSAGGSTSSFGAAYISSNAIQFYDQDNAVVNGGSAPFVWGVGDKLKFWCSIPVEEYSQVYVGMDPMNSRRSFHLVNPDPDYDYYYNLFVTYIDNSDKNIFVGR